MSYIPPKKSLGQNFLHSKSAIAQLIRVGEIIPGDTVIEIGPGKGALTLPMLEAGARVFAFELDPRMIEELSSSLSVYIEKQQLVLVQADVLEITLSDFISGPYKLIANIPYYITSAIIRKFLEEKNPPQVMGLLMQKEVAERIVSRDGKESILSLSVSVYAKARYITKVPRGAFNPQPKVDSAIVAFIPYPVPFFIDESLYQRFFALVRSAFSQKRKQVINNLETLVPRQEIQRLFSERGLSETIRAEKMTLEDWKYITEALKDFSF